MTAETAEFERLRTQDAVHVCRAAHRTRFDELAVVRAFRVCHFRAVRECQDRQRSPHRLVSALVERQYLHVDVAFRCRIEQSRQLLPHHAVAADGAPQHRFVQDHHQLRPGWRTQAFLPSHSGCDALLQLLFAVEHRVQSENRSRVVLRLQQTWHHMRRVLPDDHRPFRVLHEPPRPVRKRLPIHVRPQLHQQILRAESRVQRPRQLQRRLRPGGRSICVIRVLTT